MLSDFYWIPAGLFGIGAAAAGYYAVHEHRRYRKAKKLYEDAKKVGMEGIKDVLASDPKNPRYTCVEGTVSAMGNDKLLLKYDYERFISFTSFSGEKQLLRRSYNSFNLSDLKGSRLRVTPDKHTRVLGLSRKKEEDYGWGRSLGMSMLTGRIMLGTVEYLVYDGDYLTVFGLLKYCPGQKSFEIEANSVTSAGFASVLENLKAEASVWDTVGLGLLGLATAGVATYFGYRYYRRRYYNE